MKKLLFFLLKTLGVVVGFVVVYVLLALLLPLIPVSEERVSEAKTIPIYIYTNGVHTDLVMPTQTPLVNWSEVVPYKNTRSQNENLPYLAVGWGDKGFYLDTPEWADLKFSTAFNAAFGLGESAMHCTYYAKMKEGEDCKKIMLTETQYANLVRFVKDSFDTDESGKTILIETDAVYGTNDAFYEAKGSYSFMHTCNTWANNGLKAAGQKAALWTPTDFGIFRHYR